MSKFVGGFVVASILWGAGFALYASGVLTPEEDGPTAEVALDPEDGGILDEEPSLGMRRGRRGRSERRGRGGMGGNSGEPSNPSPRGNALTGDDLGENDTVNLDLAGEGGEQQLRAGQIQQGMDPVFNRIRRCLVLAAGDDPVSGRLTFGLRIEPNGAVSRVNLSGPRAVTTGEAGSCLRDAAKGARFDSFDGPPMIARYPITLD